MTALGDDIIDSRDLEELFQGYVAVGPGQDPDEIRERRIIRELREETEGEGWRHGIGFIREDYFESYARDLAEDIGSIDKAATWPARCIDWEQAAHELSQDYTPIVIDGIDYYYQEA